MLDQLQSLGVTPIIGASAIAAITFIFSLWDKTSGVLTKLFSFIIVPVNFLNDGGATENAFATFVNNRMKPFRFNIGIYFLKRYYIKSKESSKLVIVKKISEGSSFYLYNNVPIIIQYNTLPGPSEVPSPGGSNKPEQKIIGFKYLRGTLNEKQFLLDILNYYENEYLELNSKDSDNGIIVFTYAGKDGADDPDRAISNYTGSYYETDFRRYQTFPYLQNDIGLPARPTDKSIYLNQDLRNVLAEAQNWIDLKDWYNEKQIPWKRSYLLIGKPGTGKTLFVRTVAEAIHSNIYAFDLATMNNNNFRNAWNDANSRGYKRIILLEDIDAVFNGRENITSTAMNKGLTFDCLLQAIDGIERGDGTLLFITTNYPEKLDAAISGGNATPGDITTRPGRVDRVIEFKELEEEGSRTIVNNILGDSGLPKEELDNLIQSGIGKTPGQLQEICTRIALDRKWNSK